MSCDNIYAANIAKFNDTQIQIHIYLAKTGIDTHGVSQSCVYRLCVMTLCGETRLWRAVARDEVCVGSSVREAGGRRFRGRGRVFQLTPVHLNR